MAKKTAAPPRSPHSGKPPRRNRKRWLLAAAILALLVTTGAVIFKNYQRVRRERIISRAKAFIDQEDPAQAALSVRRALQVNPRDVEAHRLMAVLSEKAGSKQAVTWRRAVVELEPGVSKNQIAWAEAALRFNEPAVAQQALQGMSPSDQETAVYANLIGRVELGLKRLPAAEVHFAEAVRRDPKNEQYQFDRAALALIMGDTQARLTIERLAANPELNRMAQRVLYEDALRRNDSSTALAHARQLQSSPKAPFEDKMLYLGLLRQLRRREFDGYLLDMQEQSVANADHVAALITWLKDNGMSLVAVDWSKRLPVETLGRLPVPPALAEACAALNDWAAVEALVIDAKWEYAEFVRLALLARVQREQGDSLGSRNSWGAAVKVATNQPEALAMLARYGTTWGWENETTDLLWLIARGEVNQRWALKELFRLNLNNRNTRGLLSVATRMLEIDGQDMTAQNNVALLSLLLNTNIERAITIAKEAYKSHPENAGVASTHAFALYINGNTEEALRVMKSIDEKLRLGDPSYAAYYGLFLGATGATSEAVRFLEIAQRGQLLPEEQAMVARARKELKRDAGVDGLSSQK